MQSCIIFHAFIGIVCWLASLLINQVSFINGSIKVLELFFVHEYISDIAILNTGAVVLVDELSQVQIELLHFLGFVHWKEREIYRME